jgi:hypothetical protein
VFRLLVNLNINDWCDLYSKMLTRQVNLYVKNDFSLPEVYTHGNLEEVEEALWVGAQVQQLVKRSRSNDEVKKVSELKDNEITRIQTMYNEKLTKLLDDIRVVTLEKDRISGEYSEGLKDARGRERDAVGREWEEKMRILRKDNEVLQGRYETLEARRRLLEESRTRDIDEAVKRTEGLMEKLVESKQDQLCKLEGAYQRLQEVISKQTDEISKLSSNLGKRGANVKTKGSDYEEEFGEKLRRSFGLCRGFQLKDTRLGTGHEMDFSMEMEGKVVMWELKNYTSTVPKAEVEKFLRDLKENPQAKIGVMISRSTDIYGKGVAGNLVTEFDNDKMMIYINKFEEFCGDDENRIFQMLGSLFRIWWEYHREENNMFDRVEIVRELEKSIEEISKRRTEWRRHKAHLDELGRWTADLLDESEGRLDRILKRARNVDDYEVVVSHPVPEGVFRDSGEEKEMGWIRSIMKVCEAGGEIEVRELVDLLGLYHKLSKDTIRSNVMSIIKDSAVIKKGVVKYIKGISKFVSPSQIKL